MAKSESDRPLKGLCDLKPAETVVPIVQLSESDRPLKGLCDCPASAGHSGKRYSLNQTAR